MSRLLWALALGLANFGGQFDPDGGATPNFGGPFDPNGGATPNVGGQFDPNG
jgi:hypothetical protein